MRNLFFLMIVCFVSGCSVLVFRESYSLKNKTEWIHYKTKENVPNDVYQYCNEKSIENVTGRKINIENMNLDEFQKRYPFLGKCLYDKGYRFNVKGMDYIYCSHYPKICESYSKYMY